MNFINEKQVADAAVRKLESSLREKTSAFADHYRDDPKDKSIKDATAYATVKKYGSTDINSKMYMTRLSIRMGKHGFIQHFGVDGPRDSGSRTRKHPKETTYNFSAHYFKMKATPFINSAVDQSGVVDFVMQNITRLRSEAILINLRDFIERNQQ